MMHGHNTRLMEKIAANPQLGDDDNAAVSRIKGLLQVIETKTQKAEKTVIATEIFNILINHPAMMLKRAYFRSVVQEKVSQYIRECRQGQHVDLDKDVYDKFVTSVVKLQTIV